jgi:succinate dehydrogenase/fumarate reductase cytochrome b subunit
MNKSVAIISALAPFSAVAHPGHDGLGGSIGAMLLVGLTFAVVVAAGYGVRHLLAKRARR